MADDTLLDVLRKHQKSLQMNDIQFAEWLGIPTVTWRRTRAGYITMGRRVLSAAVDRGIISKVEAGNRLLETDNGKPAPGALPLRDSDTIAVGAAK